MIYLNIGSNLPSYSGNRYQNINKAILLMCEFFDITKRSHFYETTSYPNKSNPKFINIKCYSFAIGRIGSLIKLRPQSVNSKICITYISGSIKKR